MIFLDFETYSELDLGDFGVVNYAKHPSAKILCMAFTIPGKSEVMQWVPGENENHLALFDYLKNNDVPIWAWNANFEFEIWNKIGVPKYGFPEFSNFQCSMSLAAIFGSPLSLDKAGDYFGAEVVKMKEGRKAMLKFCKPQKKPGTKEEFAILLEYNRQDVLSEKAIHDKFPRKAFPVKEYKLYRLTERINRRGIFIDLDLVEAMAKVVEIYFKNTKKTIAEITEGKVESANQRVKILEFLQGLGVNLPNLQAKTVSDFLENAKQLPLNAIMILEGRQDMANNSLKKFDKFLTLRTGRRVFYTLQYFGAHTGRFSGRGIQPQNFPRNSLSGELADTAMEGLKLIEVEKVQGYLEKTFDKSFSTIAKGLLRPSIIAYPGKILLAGDFKAIENRIAAWISGDTNTLANFAKGIDQYVDMAKTIYKKENVTDEMRQIGKRIVLGCQFGLGPDGLIINLKNVNIEIDYATSLKYVNAYRKKYFKMVQFWDDLCNAAFQTYSTGRRTLVGKIGIVKNLNYLVFILPSSREFFFGNMRMGLDKRGQKAIFSGHTQLHRGIVFQNMVQAVARDVMASAMLRLDQMGLDIITTIHDEVIVEGTEDDFSIFKEAMLKKEDWFKEVPIECEFYMGKRFL